MINKLSLLTEVIAMLIFLYGLYGEKFRIDYKEVILITIDITVMQGIDNGYVEQWMSGVIYLIIAIYCIWRFGRNIKKLIVNSALYIIFLSGLQMVSFFLIFCIIGHGISEELRTLATNCVLLIFCLILTKKKKLERMSYYFQRDDIILRVFLVAGVGILLICVYMKKISKGLYLGDYVFPACAILVMFILATSWQSYKMKAREKELELQAYKLYEESYKNLISEIKLKQHEFNNHINAIYSQHLICKTYEELVSRQREYCENILYDNRYEKLLRASNSMLIGFLYGKFLEAESKNIAVEYEVKCGELQTELPMYKLIELMGNLLNNAMEALENSAVKNLYISIREEKSVYIEVRNVCEVLSTEQIAVMFQKGYSSKGENRGLGLHSIKKMGKEYGFDIVCGNAIIKDQNWIVFSVELKKPT